MSNKTRDTLVRLAKELEDAASEYEDAVTPPPTDEARVAYSFFDEMQHRYGLYYPKRSTMRDKCIMLDVYLKETDGYIAKNNHYMDILIEWIQSNGLTLPAMPNDSTPTLEQEAVFAVDGSDLDLNVNEEH